MSRRADIAAMGTNDGTLFPPAGLVGRHDARRLFGVSLTTWTVWERHGKIRCGASYPNPRKPGRCKLYPIDELRRLKAAFDREAKRLEPYPDPDRPGVVRVPVRTRKHEVMEALVDTVELPRVSGKRWSWSPGKSLASGGAVMLRMRGQPRVSLARVLLDLYDTQQFVCHLNGDRLDCRRANLGVRSRQQAVRLRKKPPPREGSPCSSRFKGVTRTQSGRKWHAAIGINGVTRYLGRFRSEIDAALAYDAALREWMGPDVIGLNLPDPAEAQRLRALEPVVEADPTWPPPGMLGRHEACAMFGVSLTTWRVWEDRGRITCGQLHPRPDKPGLRKLYPIEALERARAEIEKLGKPYPDPNLPGVWRVPLSGYLAYREALIDEADLPVVEGRNWNWSGRSDADGKTDGVVVLATTACATPLHRLVAQVTDPKVRVSFANGDPLDCRRENLVVRTLAETAQSSRKSPMRAGKSCTSRFKGVCFHADRGLWAAQIRKDGVGKSLGRFDSELDAALAYDAAARVLFGEHGHLNLPDQPSTEQALADARRALDSAYNRKRVERRRQRDLERELRRAARDAISVVESEGAQAAAMMSRREARQMFDVSRPVWRRWRRFGWLPAATVVDGRRMYPVAAIERLLLRCGLAVLPYPDPQRLEVFRVPLAGEAGQGREALIDADAVPLVQTRRWRLSPKDCGRGGEVVSMDQRADIRLHYLVMGATARGELHIGHRNDDPLDCRRANLVARTLTDTAANKRKQPTFCGRPCTSRFKGVCRPKRAKRWVATIQKGRVQRRLGSFHDEIAAAQAYDEAARELFGEHARLNFPDGVDAWLEREAAAAAVAEPAPVGDAAETREAA